LGKLEQRCRLTREIVPADHDVFPIFIQPDKRRSRGFRSGEMYKSELSLFRRFEFFGKQIFVGIRGAGRSVTAASYKY
jgi:hypothetical protein